MLNVPFIAAFLLVILSEFAFFKALSINTFSLVIPISTGINFILTIAVGYYIFQYKFSVVSLVGFILIITGILVLSLNSHVQG